jgi:hypothetical protein
MGQPETSPLGKSPVREVTPQQISDFDYSMRLKREKLTIYTEPVLVLKLFFDGLLSLSTEFFKSIVLHPLFMWFFLPLSAVWYLLEQIEHPYTEQINMFEQVIKFTVWWLSLGVLSSIGMGSGLQSGMLFLYPHIIKIFMTAQTCKTLDFEAASDMWFYQSPTQFQCPASPESRLTPVSFWGLWLKILPACFLQAAGTAIGEVPPYFISRSARLVALEAEGMNAGSPGAAGAAGEMPEELDEVSASTLVNNAKILMVRFLKNHGTIGLLLLASVPNPLFDLAGIAAGHYLMPFDRFFFATLLGKAVVRNGYQSLIYVAMADEKVMDFIVRGLQSLAPDGLQIDSKIREVLEAARAQFNSAGLPSKGGGTKAVKVAASAAASTGGIFGQLKLYWQGVMVIFLALFLLSCVTALAQHRQLLEDQRASEKLRDKLTPRMRQTITSPRSGRLLLPKPTPLSVRPKLLSPMKEFSQKKA